MKIIRSIYGNPLTLLHFPGMGKMIYQKLIDYIVDNQKIIIPDNLSIISPISSNIKDTAPIHRQCEKSGVKYYNSDLVDSKPWNMRDKPKYICDALEKVDTEYCLVTDGNDVVFCGDASSILEEYKFYERDIIFITNTQGFPRVKVETIDGYSDDEDRRTLWGDCCFINAGVCIGKTAALKEFYKELDELIKSTNIPFEQWHVRKMWDKHQDTVFIDYRCKIFETLNFETTFSKEDPTRLQIIRKEENTE